MNGSATKEKRTEEPAEVLPTGEQRELTAVWDPYLAELQRPEPVTAISPFELMKPALWIGLMARSHLNTFFDALFYDVDPGLNSSERATLTKAASPEGAILIVWPSGHPNSVMPLDELPGGIPADVNTAVVAGVGSSFMGTAAFARTVANELKRPVAGVVSGYGVADAFGEALGGWFGLGAANAVARIAAYILDQTKAVDDLTSGWTMQRTRHLRSEATTASVRDGRVGGVKECDALADLVNKATGIKYLIGHSKGNFVIENALKGVARRKEMQVVTLGAPVYMPHDINHYQVLGGADPLGLVNTRAPLWDLHIQAFATHAVAPRPFGLRVGEALRKARIL